MQHQPALSEAGQNLVLPLLSTLLPATRQQHRAHNCYSLPRQPKVAISVETLKADGNPTVHG